jgi:hypothetical protein
MKKKSHILAVRWLTTATDLLAVVAVQTDMHEENPKEWKAYLGVVGGYDAVLDTQLAAAYGAALTQEVAHEFFPQLDSACYKDS